MTIRVTYDTQILGMAMRDNAARAGIARVVDHMARGLVADADCDVRFCNAGSWELHPHCQAYLRDVCGIADATLVPAGAYSAAHRLGERGHVHVRQGSSRWAVRRVARASNAVLAGRYAGRVAAAAWRDSDVYHSPFHALPAGVGRGGTPVARFLTVYDLLPVLHPEWFDIHAGNQIVPAFLRVMDSLRPTDYVHCISESTRHDLLNHLPSLDPDRVFVATLAADRDVFHPCGDAEVKRAVRQKYGIGEHPYVLSVCTHEPRKNVESVVRAFGRVAARPGLADLRLVLVGGRGWNTAAIDESLAEGSGGRDRVVVTGYVPDADLSPLYSDARAFVYPSQYEGFGLPPLEAMSCGVPVVTSDTSSLPEVVGDAGLMVTPLDLDALTDAMLSLVLDDTLRQALAGRSVERAATFSWRRCVGRIVAEYGRAVADRR